MPKQFEDTGDATGSGMKSATRALQAWQYLIGKAASRQIARYKELRSLMGCSDDRPMSHILGCIMCYCEQNGSPPLTIIVVNKHGTPGDGFTANDLEDYHQRREDVFEFSWFKLIPPSILDFRDAYVNGTRN